MKIPKELKDLFFLLHDGIIDTIDDTKWCKEFTKDFDNLIDKIDWSE